MKKSLSFNFNSNLSVNGKKVFSSKLDEEQKLTPQQEYWLDRIMRDYGGKIFFIVLLFFALMFAVVLIANNASQNTGSSNSQTRVEFSN
jgi:hypothetical protein